MSAIAPANSVIIPDPNTKTQEKGKPRHRKRPSNLSSENFSLPRMTVEDGDILTPITPDPAASLSPTTLLSKSMSEDDSIVQGVFTLVMGKKRILYIDDFVETNCFLRTISFENKSAYESDRKILLGTPLTQEFLVTWKKERNELEVNISQLNRARNIRQVFVRVFNKNSRTLEEILLLKAKDSQFIQFKECKKYAAIQMRVEQYINQHLGFIPKIDTAESNVSVVALNSPANQQTGSTPASVATSKKQFTFPPVSIEIHSSYQSEGNAPLLLPPEDFSTPRTAQPFNFQVPQKNPSETRFKNSCCVIL